jgi:hypothetical protein
LPAEPAAAATREPCSPRPERRRTRHRTAGPSRAASRHSVPAEAATHRMAWQRGRNAASAVGPPFGGEHPRPEIARLRAPPLHASAPNPRSGNAIPHVTCRHMASLVAARARRQGCAATRYLAAVSRPAPHRA